MDDRVIAVAMVAVLAAGVWIASRAYRVWLRRAPAQDAALDSLGLPRDDRPVVLGFSGEYCLPCKTQQHPALERLRENFGTMIHVLEVDALDHAQLAARYGVLTVPTTVVLDGRRSVIAINYGVTSADKLSAQVGPAFTLRKS
jgi:thiol-disulfide isomerase/thioredoxin